MKTMKKVISVLLLVCVLASFATVSAYADEEITAGLESESTGSAPVLRAPTASTNYLTALTLKAETSGGNSVGYAKEISISATVGDNVVITPATTGEGSFVRAVTYSSNPELTGALDTGSGKQTYWMKSAGTYTVTVTTNGVDQDGKALTATCTINVKAAEAATPSSIKILEPASKNVRVNTSIALQAEVQNGDFGYWQVAYGSDGNGTFDVVSGNPKVNFTATTAGKVNIVVYTKDGTASAPLELNVTAARTPQVVCSVSRIDNSEVATFSVGNAEPGEQFTWSYTTSPSTAQIITKATDRGGEYDLTGGKGEGTVTVTAKDKYGATASITVPVNVMDTGDAKLSPTNVTWTRGQGNLTFTVEPVLYNAYIDGVCITGSGNNNKYSYVWSSKNLVINSSYLATLSAGEHILRVDTVYGSGEGINQGAGTVYAYITINGTASAAYGDNAHIRGTFSNLYFNSNSSISKVYISNQLIDPANYTLSSDGKSVTLKANFLNLLNYGSYTMKLENTSGGTETATFRIVTANYAPATGDESNLAIWVAVMLISGVGAFALIPRRKKEM